MTLYTAETLDLSRIGAPSLVPAEPLKILAERLDHLAILWEQARLKRPELPSIDTLLIEGEPARISMQEYAYGDNLLREAINDAADALRLATAVGADLDHLAITYHNTPRIVLDAGDPSAYPPRPRVDEADREYRERAQLAPESLPLFGLVPGGYVYRVRRMFGDKVKGVRALRRPNGHMDIVILAREGNGAPPIELIGSIQAAFEGESDFQSTDIVTVKPARILPVTFEAVLTIPPGPDAGPIQAAAVAGIQKLRDERHAIGEIIPLNVMVAAAHVEPARNIRIVSPLADVVGGDDAAPWLENIKIGIEIER